MEVTNLRGVFQPFFSAQKWANLSGSNQEVHASYWPMDLVDAADAPIACLYGHESIPHSSGYDNRKCGWKGKWTEKKKKNGISRCITIWRKTYQKKLYFIIFRNLKHSSAAFNPVFLRWIHRWEAAMGLAVHRNGCDLAKSRGHQEARLEQLLISWSWKLLPTQTVKPTWSGYSLKMEIVETVRQLRFYITETSNNLVVLPPKPDVLVRGTPFNWTQFYKMIPHASIGLSKVRLSFFCVLFFVHVLFQSIFFWWWKLHVFCHPIFRWMAGDIWVCQSLPLTWVCSQVMAFAQSFVQPFGGTEQKGGSKTNGFHREIPVVDPNTA